MCKFAFRIFDLSQKSKTFLKNMTNTLINSLKKSDLFCEMPDELLKSLGSIAIKRTAVKNEILFHQNQKASGFYLIIKGQIKIYRMANDGREQIIHLFGEGEIFGEVPVFQGTVYPAYAQATKKSEVFYFDRRDFLTLGKKQPEILLSLLAVLSLRLRQFVELIDDFSLKDITARLAKFLCSNCAGCSIRKVKLDMSKTRLAQSLGTIPATLSRTLKKLADLEIIKVEKDRISILDCDKLKAISSGDKPEHL
jgi:CRP/FNR family transcriptional regulator